jgi:hypothetical protein
MAESRFVEAARNLGGQVFAIQNECALVQRPKRQGDMFF